MGLLSLSIILYAALHSGKPCKDVFTQTAMAAVPGLDSFEVQELEELAVAACETTNPDIIWQIAYQESTFRFSIVRDNSGEEVQILRGAKAQRFLKDLKKNPRRANIDIGVMQFNWKWHADGFKNDPLEMIKPKEQVRYLVEAFSADLQDRCSQLWVGCYHNADKDLSRKYQQRVKKKGRILTMQALYYLKSVKDQLSPEENAKLPVIRKDQFYEVLAMSKSMPVPQRYDDMIKEYFVNPRLDFYLGREPIVYNFLGEVDLKNPC